MKVKKGYREGIEISLSPREYGLFKRILAKFHTLAGQDQKEVKWFCTSMRKKIEEYEEKK